ncbi:MAG TPA: FkbM family methyltransferase [Thermoleophilaceae bacterium]
MRKAVEVLADRFPLSRSNRFRRVVGAKPRGELVWLGSPTAGRMIVDGLLDSESVCYCGGVGEDISFDLELIERYGCEVYAFDPTPTGVQHVEAVAPDPERFHFLPVGLWSSDTTRTFAPLSPGADNWSTTRAADGTAVSAPCRSLSSLMHEHGHTRIDLLKLDVEGAEYDVLDAMLADDLEVRILCVEFHKDPSIDPMSSMTRRLAAAGYDAFHVDGFDVGYVRSPGAP